MAVKAFVLIQTEIEVATTNEVVAVLRKIGAEIQTVDRVCCQSAKWDTF